MLNVQRLRRNWNELIASNYIVPPISFGISIFSIALLCQRIPVAQSVPAWGHFSIPHVSTTSQPINNFDYYYCFNSCSALALSQTFELSKRFAYLCLFDSLLQIRCSLNNIGWIMRVQKQFHSFHSFDEHLFLFWFVSSQFSIQFTKCFIGNSCRCLCAWSMKIEHHNNSTQNTHNNICILNIIINANILNITKIVKTVKWCFVEVRWAHSSHNTIHTYIYMYEISMYFDCDCAENKNCEMKWQQR